MTWITRPVKRSTKSFQASGFLARHRAKRLRSISESATAVVLVSSRSTVDTRLSALLPQLPRSSRRLAIVLNRQTRLPGFFSPLQLFTGLFRASTSVRGCLDVRTHLVPYIEPVLA